MLLLRNNFLLMGNLNLRVIMGKAGILSSERYDFNLTKEDAIGGEYVVIRRGKKLYALAKFN